ncbi:MAG: hypothetical protein RLN63_02060, partial [Miltoncostaeaceae bacterium]
MASFERSGYAPPAWLLSSHRLDRETERLAGWVREEGADLFADNGTHPRIEALEDRHRPGVVELSREIRALRRGLGPGRRIPVASEVPASLTRRAREAVGALLDDVDRDHDMFSGEALLADQLRMGPTHLIAREDYAVATMLALGLEREITRLDVDWFRRRNRITLGFWREVVDDPRTRDIDVFATLSAVDYNTALAVGRMAAQAGVRRVALGFAGLNSDSTFAERYMAGPGRVLPGAAPRRYVRMAEILCGLRDGYRDAGVRLLAFHALGCGASSQFPLLAGAFDWWTHISTDATSPLHDSVRDRVYYDDTAWGDRLHITGAARRVLGGGEWSFSCPFCDYVRGRFGHDPEAARSWWEDAGRPDPAVEDLDPEEPLGRHLPAFATA